MSAFLNQALHNEDFHQCICDKFPDGFFDWKVTVVFYTAIHYLKVLAGQKGISIGESHGDIRSNVKPPRPGGKPPAVPLTENAYSWYDLMYEASRGSRYPGFTDPETFQEIMKAEHIICLEALEKFKKYIVLGQKLDMPAKPSS